MNTAARLQGEAEPGQIVISQRLFDRFSDAPAGARTASLVLEGQREAEPARVVDLSAPRSVDR